MSRLDQHIAAVRNKLALNQFLQALAWGGLIYAGVVLLAVLVDRVLHVAPPRGMLLFQVGIGATVLAALLYSMMKRPTPHQAAVAIDDRLQLKEKFSTALHARAQSDPFAMAAVRDAEHTAETVSLHRRFPLKFPRIVYGTAIAMLAALLAARFMEPIQWFGEPVDPQRKVQEIAAAEQAKRNLQQALVQVRSAPAAIAQEEAIERARLDIEAMLSKPITDPGKANRTAMSSLQRLEEALKNEAKNSRRYADAQQDARMLRSLGAPTEPGAVNEARKALAKGEFSEAADQLEQVIANFDNMTEAERSEAAGQMEQLARQLQDTTDDPDARQRTQDQLQSMGMDQQQAEQMARRMEEAAQGDQEAERQIQHQVEQRLRQMNNGQGPTAQQREQIERMVQQMQSQANSQASAQRMQQAAQQMAQAMQQMQQEQLDQQGRQECRQQAQEGMANMRRQLGAMESAAADAQRMQAAQQAARQAAQQAADTMNGQAQSGQGQQPGQGEQAQANQGQAQGRQGSGGQQPGQGQGQQAGPNGQWSAGHPGQQDGGMGGPGAGRGRGRQEQNTQAPSVFTPEISPSADYANGRILASSLIKGNQPLAGEAREQLKEIVQSVNIESTDEVDQQRISRQNQKAVTEYFRSMEKDVQ